MLETNDKVIISRKNIAKAIEYLKQIDESQMVEVCIMQDLALDLEILNSICDAHTKIYFNIMYNENDNRAIVSERYGTAKNWNNRDIHDDSPDYLMFSKQETKAFINNYNFIKQRYNTEIIINNEFTVDMAINATNRVNEWVDEIENVRINGKPLSPFEKYLYAYQIVSRFVYKKYDDDDGFSRNSRDLISVLNSDYIVCSGYAKLLSELCKKMNIQCDCQMLNNHQLCTIDIEDPKYKLRGRFLSDPTRGNYITNIGKSGVDLY